ncbi:MAG: hypothetical protein IFK93_00250 [Acidobacteria bacterium]|uniref:Anti sigma-E protein RseA N-terminal domain-containing protein n=1 Tax=Candidatus Sulfomarinibacter kjeldsenii TaxID=2885994 RepID=A0A8J6XXS8_9BACT|nr:hypothetical protein [Candidatus Sulfomarinibacter kjeldsenii]MBD3855015.1 hypothetical protein [Candidatus Sulfomarinibacter kjeldsenii]MBD3870987.1 hypothetical protein [Candidatus Sulfomarinibacter kjeldsenii]
MTDETILEILSRHLDGDLNADEEVALSARLDAEPALANELETMRRIRRSVAALASSEQLPPELDSLVDPLLRGKPEPIALRSWARWLATAAAVVLGATVIIEVNRRNPGPSIESMAKLRKQGHPAEPTERFTLAPLPTSSLPVEQQPLGASDRLLASPAPDIELDDPVALEVLGPLEEGEVQTVDDQKISGGPVDEIQPMGSAAAEDKGAKKGESLRTTVPGEKDDLDHAPQRKESDGALEDGRGAALQSWAASPPMGQAQLFVFVNGKSAWRDFTPPATCKAGRYSVRIVVAGGAVREARPVGGAASAAPSQRLCAAGLILDLEIDEVADGEYPAEIVVKPRGSGQ